MENQAESRCRCKPLFVSFMSIPHPSVEDSTMLCLACSSSMPPSVIKRYKKGLLGNDDKAFEKPIFFTNCCRRPICPSCIIANARLVRYDPCLHCLGGVDVVASGMASTSKLSMATDQDLFVLGDDDEDAEALPQVGPPPCEAARRATEVEINTVKQGDGSIEPNSSQKDPTPVKHYLTPSDTLQGISLRYGVNVSEISLRA